MSTWQIFSDARNDFRWEMSDQQLQNEEQCDAVPQQHTNTGRLPSMADLLLLGYSKLVKSGIVNLENPPLFRTALGKSVDVKQSSIGDIDDTGHLDRIENGYASSKPTPGVASLNSAVVLKSGSQRASENVVNMSNSMFQTGSGKKVSLSSAGLLRAKALLALDENYEEESMNGFEQEQKQKQSTSTHRLAWDNPSHLETQAPRNLNIISSASGNAVNTSNSMFQTASGKKVNISSACLLGAKTLLDENYDQESTSGFEQKLNQSTTTDRLAWDNPSHLETQVPSNLNISSSASGNVVNMSNSMFQTASGEKVNLSSACLLKAKTLLDENLDQESTDGFEQKQKQSMSTDRLAWDNPSHLETQGPSNLNFSSSTKILSSSINKSSSCISEPMKFPDFMNPAAKPPPVKFLTSGGRSISVSNDALQRARSLLGNPECDSFPNEASAAADDGKPSCASNPNHDSSTPLFPKRTENGDSSSMDIKKFFEFCSRPTPGGDKIAGSLPLQKQWLCLADKNTSFESLEMDSNARLASRL